MNAFIKWRKTDENLLMSTYVFARIYFVKMSGKILGAKNKFKRCPQWLVIYQVYHPYITTIILVCLEAQSNMPYYLCNQIIWFINCDKKNRSKTHKKQVLRLLDVRQLQVKGIKFVLQKFLRLLIIKWISGRNNRLTSFHFAMNELLMSLCTLLLRLYDIEVKNKS